MPKKTPSPAKDDPPPEQDYSAPDVHMDSGAQQNPSASDVQVDTGAQLDAPETAEDAGAGDTSAGIDKGKGPAVPEVRTIPAPAPTGSVTPAPPEQPAPTAPTPESTSAPAKTGTFKIHQIIKTVASPAASALASAKPAHPSSAMTLH
jgi:hypothetical protein